MSKPKKLNFNGESKVIKYLTTCINWLLDSHSVDKLDDVTLTNISDGQILKYDSTTHKFVNDDESGGTYVEANPSGTATDTLDTLQVGNTIYNVNGLPFQLVIDANDNGINIVYDDSILSGGGN